jgi:signal transduction histidine kinase
VKLGLFELLFWRVAAVLAATVGVLVVFSHLGFERELDRAWRSDLQQQAEWAARQWRYVMSNHADDAAVSFAADWRAIHDAVRLTVRDAAGRVVLDSRPERGALDDEGTLPMLIGRAALGPAADSSELTLSRKPPAPFLLRNGALIGLAMIVLLASAAVFPFVRQLRRQFERLADFARRVAGGELGATLPFSGRREVDALIVSLNDMSCRLQHEEQRKHRLLSDVSHELRSPLARLHALADTIGRHPAEASIHLAGIGVEVALMDRLIGDLLQTARLEEQGATLLRLEPVALGAWAPAVFDRQRNRIEAAGVCCRVSIAAADATARIDAQRLTQALGNLVENAISATSGCRDPAIELSLSVGQCEWSLAVGDNGRGIPAPALPFLFDRFFRVETDRDRRSGGTGLGLSLVRAITCAHGGRPNVESRDGAGTTVALVFPLARSDSFPTNDRYAPNIQDACWHGRN